MIIKRPFLQMEPGDFCEWLFLFKQKTSYNLTIMSISVVNFSIMLAVT